MLESSRAGPERRKVCRAASAVFNGGKTQTVHCIQAAAVAGHKLAAASLLSCLSELNPTQCSHLSLLKGMLIGPVTFKPTENDPD